MFWIFIVLGIIVLLLMILLYCVAAGKMTTVTSKTAGAFIGRNFAHRGLHTRNQEVPENSLAAFLLAKEKGYGVELDVRLSKDKKVIVFHDDDLKRICGLDKQVSESEWSEISKLKLFGTEERIPLFSEALSVLGDTPIIVEIKTAGEDNAILCQKTFEILHSGSYTWCVESFDPRVLKWFRKNHKDVLRGQLSSPPAKNDLVSRFTAFLLGNVLTNFMSRPHFISYSNDPHPLGVRFCRLMKPMMMIWTIRPEHDIKRCEEENDTIIFEYYQPEPRFKEIS
jgi:glycerophosphoryl diester phosphodiesterase